MKFFNIDFHASTIEDIRHWLARKDHEVVDYSFSNHAWVHDKTPYETFGALTKENWGDVTVQEFYDDSKELSGYDGFIASYPPSLARLYSKYDKPIIVDIPIRYEHPYTNDPESWAGLNLWFQQMCQKNQVIVIANNRYDQQYFEYFTGITPIYIPMLCRYIIQRYDPKDDRTLIMDCKSSALIDRCEQEVPGAVSVRKAFPGRYRSQDICNAGSLVHFPYNASLMSFFEHYTMSIPIFVPTKRFLLELHQKYNVLTELSWNMVNKLSPGSKINAKFLDLPDPNLYHDPQALMAWMEYYDFYRFEHVLQFDSFEELREKRTDVALLGQTHVDMTAANDVYCDEVAGRWDLVLEQVDKGIQDPAPVMMLEIPEERWAKAQKDELELWMHSSCNGDDWNQWWTQKFNNYSFMSDVPVGSLMEVGCGPYAGNTKSVLSALPTTPPKVTFSDPLLKQYLDKGYAVKQLMDKLSADKLICPLETTPTDQKYDCVICINVLDHVYNVEQCMNVLYDLLNPGGVLILGQDVSNDVDVVQCPEMVIDIMHPIRMDREYLAQFIDKYEPLYDVLLPREQGRNPKCHYGTLLFAGKRPCVAE